MLMLALAVPVLSFHFFAVLVLIVCAFLIVFWLLSKSAVPEPFNYVLYAFMALLALWLIFWLVSQV